MNPKKSPVVELSDCVKCEICVDLCPEIFFMSDTGFVDVVDCDEYPETEVDEVIKNCPEKCIYWSTD